MTQRQKKSSVSILYVYQSPQFLGGSDGKKSAWIVGDTVLIPRMGRSLGGGNENPLKYSCLENSMDRGVWQLQSLGSKQSDMIDNTFTFFFQFYNRCKWQYEILILLFFPSWSILNTILIDTSKLIWYSVSSPSLICM